MPADAHPHGNAAKARDVAEQIQIDLTSRRGLRQAWDEIDPEIQAKIIDEWARIIEQVFRA